MNQNYNDDRKEDQPLYSRLFVVCGKLTKEQELREVFEEYGVVEDLFMPRNRNNGEPKGVAFVKYSKTSSAAAAIKALNMTTVNNRTIKVMVAASKNDPECHDQFGQKYTRLFIRISKETTDKELNDYFSQFGQIASVYIIRDKNTGDNKGFAYIKFVEFYDAAKAFEDCDRSYKPKFAAPKELKRTRSNLDNDSLHSGQSSSLYDYNNCNRLTNFEYQKHDYSPYIKGDGQDYKTVQVICSPILHKKYIHQLMNLVPGMVKLHYKEDINSGLCKAQVTYEDSKFASYAVERLNKYEFPSGEIVTVKPDANPLQKAATDLTDMVKNFKNSAESGANLMDLADAIEKASTLIKAAAKGQLEPQENNTSYCNVPLPSPKPVSNSSRVAQRLFIVCKPEPPPQHILHDTFCRFGDFISVCTFPNKTFGFVKYASSASAQEAMRVLNGATVFGKRLKVLEADERPTSDDKTQDYTDNDSKRMKYDTVTED